MHSVKDQVYGNLQNDVPIEFRKNYLNLSATIPFHQREYMILTTWNIIKQNLEDEIYE